MNPDNKRTVTPRMREKDIRRVTIEEPENPDTIAHKNEKTSRLRKVRKSLSWFLPEHSENDENGGRRDRIKSYSRLSEMTFTTLNCPDEGATIAFHNYTYKVKYKTILDGVTGNFLAGRLTAIMGPSGSGKTSLIETLAGSNFGGSKDCVTADILTLNGQSCTRDDIAAISGFVQQDDTFVPTMKVKEAIQMSAYLRLPRNMNDHEREKRVEEGLRMFNLEGCEDTMLGGQAARGVSGGEKRRVSIAREIIANPPVLFLDEPTNGLDAFTSLTVVQTLKDLAQQGRTIVITIHQPGSEIFGMFDDLVLLSGGKVVYWGSLKRVLKYFDKRGYYCPEFANPADFLFMNVLGPDGIMDGHYSESRGLEGSTDLSCPKRAITMWLESHEYVALKSKIEASDPSKCPKATPLMSKAPFIKQFTFLYTQYLKTGLRSPLSLPMRLVFALYSGLTVGLTYAMLRSDDFFDQVRGKTGALSFMMTNFFVAGFLGCIQVMWEDRNVFMRDYRSHYYDVTPAYIAKMMVTLPVDFIGGILSVSISYYMIGLNPAFSAFLFVAVVGAITQVVGILAGFVVGYSVADPRRMVASSIIFVLTFMIYGGTFIIPEYVPGYLRWLVYLDPIYYAFTSSMQVGFNQCPDVSSASKNNPVYPCQRTVAFDIYGINDALPAGVNLALLTTLGLVLCFLGWISLSLNCKYRSK